MSGEDKKVYLRACSSILQVPDMGFFCVVHFDDEDPLDVAEKDPSRVGGPFSTMDAAETTGSAILTELMSRLNKKGIKTQRPGKA